MQLWGRTHSASATW